MLLLALLLLALLLLALLLLALLLLALLLLALLLLRRRLVQAAGDFLLDQSGVFFGRGVVGGVLQHAAPVFHRAGEAPGLIGRMACVVTSALALGGVQAAFRNTGEHVMGFGGPFCAQQREAKLLGHGEVVGVGCLFGNPMRDVFLRAGLCGGGSERNPQQGQHCARQSKRTRTQQGANRQHQHRQRQGPGKTFIPQSFSTDALLRALQAPTDFVDINPLDIPASTTGAHVGAMADAGDVLQQRFVETAHDHIPGAVLFEAAFLHRNRRAVGGSDADGVEVHAGFPRCFGGFSCISFVVFAVGDEQDGAVSGTLGAEEGDSHRQRGADVGALGHQCSRAAVADLVPQHAVIEGEWHAGIRAAREDDEANAVAGQQAGEVKNLSLCPFHAIGRNIGRIHGTADIQHHHEVQAFALQLLPTKAPPRLGQCKHAQHHRAKPKQQAGAMNRERVAAHPLGSERTQAREQGFASPHRRPQQQRHHGSGPQKLQAGRPTPAHGNLRSHVWASTCCTTRSNMPTSRGPW